MDSGGLVMMPLKRIIVKSPRSSSALLMAAIVSFVTLNGDIGSIVSRLFTKLHDAEQTQVAHATDAGVTRL